MDLFIALGIGAGAGLAALLGCLVQFRKPSYATASIDPDRGEDRVVFLLHDGAVYNATDSAKRLLPDLLPEETGWEDIRNLMLAMFPQLPEKQPQEPLFLRAGDQPDTYLSVQTEGSGLRIELSGRSLTAADRILFILQGFELDRLTGAMGSIPCPFWESGADGRVIWANAAYRDLAARVGSDPPDAPLFDIVMTETTKPTRVRTSIADQSGTHRFWYEITSRQSGETWLHHAVDIDAVVKAETAQRNFVQTLTKTFAHLPIGLAVFDRNRQLALFNPALIDLTSLPADFLSGRPNLSSFFDHMRENRLMPEPKNYSGWREQMAELVAAASDDRYCETWSLPSGLTYKITGRPHPDGAVAFLIEDISSEITLTRRFRAEMELSQSVLDAIEDAVSVFSHLGVLTFCNAAYRSLWKCDPDSAFADMTVLDATRLWQQGCEPSPIWGDLRDFVLASHDRAAWDAELTLKTGLPLKCNVEPVSGGATVVRFSIPEPMTLPEVARMRLSSEG